MKTDEVDEGSFRVDRRRVVFVDELGWLNSLAPAVVEGNLNIKITYAGITQSSVRDLEPGRGGAGMVKLRKNQQENIRR